jgi:predicted alpha/beta hydrolase family esterase
VDIGARGHINADSGLGDWDEGRLWLASLAAQG